MICVRIKEMLMLRPIPIFEAKNKLPLFIHQAESDGPVFIARRNQNVAVLVSFAEYNSLVASARKKKAGNFGAGRSIPKTHGRHVHKQRN